MEVPTLSILKRRIGLRKEALFKGKLKRKNMREAFKAVRETKEREFYAETKIN